MSRASNREPARAPSRNERWQHWIALLFSALLHVLMAVLLLYAAKPTMSTPQGAAGGSRIKVDFIGQTKRPDHPVPPRPTPPPAQAPAHPRRARAASPVQSTLVAHADDPVPPTDTATQATENAPIPTSEKPTTVTAPVPSPAQDTPTPSQAQTTASAPPPPTERRPQIWTGRPPGALDTDTATDNSGLADGPGNHGQRHDLDASQPSLEVGGYLVYYDLGSETQLRAWQRQGMKELFILLPGTEYRMVCPLGIALSRGSGKCRALPPDSPELKTIGDARQVITMLQVYHHGELVWRGPGPYR